MWTAEEVELSPQISEGHLDHFILTTHSHKGIFNSMGVNGCAAKMGRAKYFITHLKEIKYSNFAKP